MLKTFIRTTACLAVSAAAIIIVTRLDATAAKGRRESAPETDAPPKTTAPKPAPPKPAPPSTPKLTVASLTTPAPAPAPAPATATNPGANDGSAVTLPDWKGKRLSVALRAARKLGVNVTAVDDTGEQVTADAASEYRVRRQLTKAGTAVEPGADVEVRVREIAEPAMGY